VADRSPVRDSPTNARSVAHRLVLRDEPALLSVFHVDAEGRARRHRLDQCPPGIGQIGR